LLICFLLSSIDREMSRDSFKDFSRDLKFRRMYVLFVGPT